MYKSKSNGEIERKIAALESKTKQDAKALKLENEELKDMMNFKENKLAEMQQDVDRLRLVIKSEARQIKMPTASSISKLEKK